MPVIGRRQLKLSREDVRQWLVNYAIMEKRPPLKKYLEQKVKEEGYSDVSVDMGDHGEKSVAELILMDLESYARG